jgi:hypothetical protein
MMLAIDHEGKLNARPERIQSYEQQHAKECEVLMVHR